MTRSRLPLILTPLETVAELGELEVALLSVELWPQQTVVRLAGLVDDPIAEEHEHGARLDAWAHAGRQGPIPTEPDDCLGRLELSLADDVGSELRLRVKSYGGSGRLYRADWFFEGGVSELATTLEVTVTGDGTTTLSLRIARP